MLLDGIDRFNNKYFFEAHDIFEEIWMDERGRSRRFYQGLVQLATGFYHLTMQNKDGGISQLAKACEKLKEFKPEYNDVELKELLRQVHGILEDLSADNIDLSESSFIASIPKIEYRRL